VDITEWLLLFHIWHMLKYKTAKFVVLNLLKVLCGLPENVW